MTSTVCASSLYSRHENVVFSVCVRMDNAAYIISIIYHSISGLEAWYHFRFNISCGVAVIFKVVFIY